MKAEQSSLCEWITLIVCLTSSFVVGLYLVRHFRVDITFEQTEAHIRTSHYVSDALGDLVDSAGFTPSLPLDPALVAAAEEATELVRNQYDTVLANGSVSFVV